MRGIAFFVLVVVSFTVAPFAGVADEGKPALLGIVRASEQSISIGPFERSLPSGVDWTSALQVRVVVKGDVPPISGEIRAEGKILTFIPTFPFSARAAYKLNFEHKDFEKIEKEFRIESQKEPTPLAKVAAVYPEQSILPENQLKFYIHFTQPMSQGEAYQHIKLYDSEDNFVDDPFLELSEELWDVEGKRLTVFLDPGRVKRGLKPHEDVGPVLVSGREYSLRIDKDWKDAERRPLKNSFRKVFQTGPADYAQPAPEKWKFTLPTKGTREPLIVKFGEALDHALVQRLVEVRAIGERERLQGQGKTIDRDTAWTFVPTDPWTKGDFELHAGSELEDLAGNSVHKPFEVTEDNPGRFVIGPTVARPFAIK